jgi:4-diphosphocytidyl-2-C-methyl-D-erythritol kinase
VSPTQNSGLDELRNLPAPAKLNLFLHVTGRRRDGYHELETVFELIDLYDSIDLKRCDDGRVNRRDDLPGVPADTDLTVRAARLLAQHTGCRLGVEISLRKVIPMGGGLGGGSSDAATVLMGLNRLWNLHLSRAQLMRIGLELGADVPFFIFGRSAYATGVGERLRPCPQAQRSFVLLTPAVAVPTAKVFSHPELTRNTKPLKIFGLSQGQNVFRGKNDLEPIVRQSFLSVDQALGSLEQVSSQLRLPKHMARMSGSGSCVFLPVPDVETAARALGFLSRMQIGSKIRRPTVQVVSSVARHPLVEWAFR